MARAAIDAGQARVAWLGDDSRIRVVQTRGSQAAQSLAEKDHLVQQLTTICWGPSKVVVETSDAQPSKKRKRAEEGSSASELCNLLTVGSATGRIAVWDVARGKVLARFGGTSAGHSGRVTSLACHDGDVYSAGDDGHVFVISCSAAGSGGAPQLSEWQSLEYAISCIAVSAGYVACGSTSIVLFDRQSKARLATFTGHATAVASLAFSADGRLLVSAAEADRYISLFDCTVRDSAPVRIFSVIGEPRALALSRAVDGAGTCHLACLLSNGSVCVWNNVLGEARKRGASGSIKSRSPACTLVVLDPHTNAPFVVDAAADDARMGAQIAMFDATRPADTLLVGHGHALSLAFDRVRFAGDDGEVQAQVTLQGQARGGALLDGGAGQRKQAAATATATGSAAAGASASTMHIASGLDSEHVATAKLAGLAASSKKRKRDASSPESGRVARTTATATATTTAPAHVAEYDSLSGGEAEALASGAAGPTFAEQLKAAAGKHSSSGAARVLAAGVDDSAAPLAGQEGPRMSAESMATVVVQALKASDDARLESVLTDSSGKAIDATLQRLPAPCVVQLLKTLVTKFYSRPLRGPQLVPWIKAIMRHHTSMLLGVPGIASMLAPLETLIDDRLANYKRLNNLAGRLDLILAQVAVLRVADAGESAGAVNATNVLMEGEDDDEASEASACGMDLDVDGMDGFADVSESSSDCSEGTNEDEEDVDEEDE